MLRFIPDSWVDTLLRPLLLADSAAGLYTEIHAPDWRFAALALLLALGAFTRQGKLPLLPGQWRWLLGLFVCFYLWTLVSGNGRYFLWGMLMVGPLVVVAARRLPASAAMRNTVIVGVLLLQGLVVSMTFEPNVWGLRPWPSGPGLTLERAAVREQPGVFLTIGAISHSIVVPYMHPQSRWANIAGQQEIVPGMPEYARLREVLASPLPKYVMVRATKLVLGTNNQPLPQATAVVARAIGRQGLELHHRPCEVVEAPLIGLPAHWPKSTREFQGYLFCPVRLSTATVPLKSQIAVAPEVDYVFEQVENRCPRFFPPGGARTRAMEGAFVRSYLLTDVNLYVDDSGEVYFKHFRALNPTALAKTEDVRRGQFQVDCERLPGRYVPPWARD